MFIDAMIIAVAVLGIIVVGAALTVNAMNRKPKLEGRLKAAERERDDLMSLAKTLYKTASESRDTYPEAALIALQIERCLGTVRLED